MRRTKSRRVTTTTPRRRRRKRRIIDGKRFALCTLSLALLVVALMTLFNAPFFAIRHVRIVGNKLVPTRQVLQSVKFVNGGNIFLTSGERISRSVRRDPIVAGVRIHRQIPRTLIIAIGERKPHFVLNTGTALYEVDHSGIPYRKTQAVGRKLPVIVCRFSRPIALGNPLKSARFASARACLLLAESKKIPNIAQISVDQTGYLCLNVRDKYQVKLGRPDGLQDKFDVVQRVLKQIPDFERRGAYVDVTCPGESAIKYVE